MARLKGHLCRFGLLTTVPSAFNSPLKRNNENGPEFIRAVFILLQ
jgi:hypothetical protein|tara:strand:- start:76 stop:210 length:135 start_codon:yes stop_codon:yes gene_type:complete